MAREAHAKQARRKISVEDKQPSSFPSLPGPQAVHESPIEASKVGEPYDGQLSPAVRRGLSSKRMFFDTPRTWILYEPMDRDKSLLLAMTSSFVTSSFPYPSPLFSVTHQMALSSYL
ncbi:hypothetical protein Ahy_B06g083548 [Arachis hypogaea]|uniref:NADH-ubiquinone oxidoreductase chain 2 n=1 Tax=Arachis hypogaea TaxID=3818 RepID=A0A444YQ83_ARAHY|nr:hypothetical protein Ahy_B06g083548 [Arachis hypogaea]